MNVSLAESVLAEDGADEGGGGVKTYTARGQVVASNGPVSTPSSIASNNCMFCMGVGLGLPMDICADSSCFVTGDPPDGGGTDVDEGELGETISWSLLAALGIGIKGAGFGLVGSGVTSCAGVVTCLVGAENGTVFRIVGGDGVERLLVQSPGDVNGIAGRFEWIVDGGSLTHQMFVRGGTINGIPIIP